MFKENLFASNLWSLVDFYFPSTYIDYLGRKINEKVFKNQKAKLISILSYKNHVFSIQILVTDLAYNSLASNMNGKIIESAQKFFSCFEKDFIKFKDFEILLCRTYNHLLATLKHTKWLKEGYVLYLKEVYSKVNNVDSKPLQLTLCFNS